KDRRTHAIRGGRRLAQFRARGHGRERLSAACAALLRDPARPRLEAGACSCAIVEKIARPYADRLAAQGGSAALRRDRAGTAAARHRLGPGRDFRLRTARRRVVRTTPGGGTREGSVAGIWPRREPAAVARARACR